MKKLFVLTVVLICGLGVFTACESGVTMPGGQNTPGIVQTEQAEESEWRGDTTQPHVHELADRAAVEPTCTESGLTEGAVCALCGEILV